ncbi:hypothetical protein [Mesorhizobium sp. WSM2239]|uniref:Uncharacterized protein n=2 Tax=unclassified Mesorhizobium TaxID=325217 RepID=A0AAU8DHQ8_9HYPH
MHLETSRFELELNQTLFYLRADIGKRRIAICKVWREAWRHMEWEWYDRARRYEEVQRRRERRRFAPKPAAPEASRVDVKPHRQI